MLIDYQKSDLSVLGLVNKHVGALHVLTTTLDEVDGLDVVDCERLGLEVIEPRLPQVTLAATRKGRLSFRDHLFLIVASDEGFTCVTNDRALRKACEEESVALLWGLEMMRADVSAGTPAPEHRHRSRQRWPADGGKCPSRPLLESDFSGHRQDRPAPARRSVD